MRTLLLVSVAAALGACSSARAPASEGAASRPGPSSSPSSKEAEQCQSMCERSSQARAVAADIISRDCRARCRAELASPLVDSAAAAERALGRHVRVSGVYDGQEVTLADGSRVRVERPEGLSLRSGRVELAGRLVRTTDGFVLHADRGAQK